MKDSSDQSLTRTNLMARILQRDRRALIGMATPPIRSLPWKDETGIVTRRICPVDGSAYVYQHAKDSPCGHVKADGTIIP